MLSTLILFSAAAWATVQPPAKPATAPGMHGPLENRQIVRRLVELPDHGPAHMIVSIEGAGMADTVLRGLFTDATSRDRQALLKSYVGTDVPDGSIRTSDVDDRQTPFRVVIDAYPPGRATGLIAARVELPLGIVARSVGLMLAAVDRVSRQDDPVGAGGGLDPVAPGTVTVPPFELEWQHVIRPPSGFRPQSMPKAESYVIGPATLNQQVVEEPDGKIVATARFYSAAGSYTVEELADARRQLAKVAAAASNLQLVSLPHQLLWDGRARDAVKGYEEMIARAPRVALYHARLADALWQIGLMDRARAEAVRATELGPTLAIAHAWLGGILAADAIGRPHSLSTDYSGAVREYQRAIELDPDDLDWRASLIDVLQRNQDGVRFGRGAHLDGAVAEYRALRRRPGYNGAQDDAFLTLLLWRGDFREIIDVVQELSSSADRRALAIAASAALDGPEAAQALALGSATGDGINLLYTASVLLLETRHYREGEALLNAVSPPAAKAAERSSWLSIARKARVHDTSLPMTDPLRAIEGLDAAVLNPVVHVSETQPFISRRLLEKWDPSDMARAAIVYVGAIHERMAAGGEIADALIDGTIASTEYRSEGNDEVGYRVRNLAAVPWTRFVVKEDRDYRLLATSFAPAPIGTLVLDLIDAGAPTAARQWLDWARDESRTVGGGDRFAGLPISRLWPAGQTGDLGRMRYAAAALAVMQRPGRRELDVLLEGRRLAPTDDERLSFAWALSFAYRASRQWAELADVSRTMLDAVPDSTAAFNNLVHAYTALGQYREAERRIDERLSRLPNDIAALTSRALNEAAQGHFREARAVLEPRVIQSSASLGELNEYAWLALAEPEVDARAVDAARTAYRQVEQTTYIVQIGHTLACVLAATGRVAEAHEYITRIVTSLGLEAMDAPVWFYQGIVAHSVGDDRSAQVYLTRAIESDRADGPNSIGNIARERLKALGARRQ